MRFYLMVAFLILGLFGFSTFAFISVVVAAGLTLFNEPTNKEMQSDEYRNMRLITGITGLLFLFVGQWFLALCAVGFYVVYNDRFKAVVQQKKHQNAQDNQSYNTMEND